MPTTKESDVMDKVTRFVVLVAVSYLSRVQVRRALVANGMDHKMANRLITGAMGAAYLLGLNFRAGWRYSDQVDESLGL